MPQDLKFLRLKEAETWAKSFLAGGTFEGMGLEIVGKLLNVNAGLRGCKVVDSILQARRTKIDECWQNLAEVERILTEFDEAGKILQEVREELLKDFYAVQRSQRGACLASTLTV